jgi:hypothetical protein
VVPVRRRRRADTSGFTQVAKCAPSQGILDDVRVVENEYERFVLA